MEIDNRQPSAAQRVLPRARTAKAGQPRKRSGVGTACEESPARWNPGSPSHRSDRAPHAPTGRRIGTRAHAPSRELEATPTPLRPTSGDSGGVLADPHQPCFGRHSNPTRLLPPKTTPKCARESCCMKIADRPASVVAHPGTCRALCRIRRMPCER